MIGLRRALMALGLAGFLTGLAAALLAFASDHNDDPWIDVILGLTIGWAFIGTGLFAWWRRPSSRFGALMCAVGFTWFLGSLTAANSDLVFTIGIGLSLLWVPAVGHMLLAFPSGRLRSRAERRLVLTGYALATLGILPILLWGDDREFRGCDCPRSVLHIADGGRLYEIADGFISFLGVLFLVATVSILVQRWRRAIPTQRRAMAPVLWSGATMLLLVGALLASDVVGLRAAQDAINVAALAFFASVPFAFLLGILRSRVSRAGAVSELLVRLGQEAGSGGLRQLLSTALGDRSLQLVYWIGDRRRYVDEQGRSVELPARGDHARSWTAVDHEGERVGAIVHDAHLREDPDLLQSVAAAAGLAVQNERLQAQLRARVSELHESRARLVEVGTQERRRLERNLHDGAQQRLVALSLALRLAQSRLEKDPVAAAELLAGAQDELNLALAELRELARGIHPAVLSDRGLDAALEALAGRAPVPVEIVETPPQRLPEPVEAAAYFVVSEAMANLAKHSGASYATVRVARENGTVMVEVADDGVGGADPERGSGLRGLADRIAALDGELALESPRGSGTRLRARIPCTSVNTAPRRPPVPAAS